MFKGGDGEGGIRDYCRLVAMIADFEVIEEGRVVQKVDADVNPRVKGLNVREPFPFLSFLST